MANVNVDKVLKIAAKYIGVKESPPNSNKCIFNTAYYGKAVSGPSYPWCAVFMWYVFREAGASNLYYGGSKCAYTPSIYNYYKGKGKVYSTPAAGDLVLFKFPGSNRINHVGIVEKVISPTKIQTIEGNTSVGNNSNGGEVMRRTRATTYVAAYCRPDYDNSSVTVKESTSYSKTTFITDVQKALKVDVTGVVNEKTIAATPTISRTKNPKHAVVLPLQKYLKSINLYTGALDRETGPKLEAAMKAFQSTFMKNPDGEFTAKGTSWKKILGYK